MCVQKQGVVAIGYTPHFSRRDSRAPAPHDASSAMASTDLYALLKVDKDVQPPQLKKAYYALARKVHPDKRPGDKQAKADFLALKKAYDILSDPVRRCRYDRTGSVEDDADFAAAYELSLIHI